jgi:hypothetical protein
LTTKGKALEAIPEPSCLYILLGGLIVIAIRRLIVQAA